MQLIGQFYEMVYHLRISVTQKRILGLDPGIKKHLKRKVVPGTEVAYTGHDSTLHSMLAETLSGMVKKSRF